MNENSRILIFGIGAVGTSVAYWMSKRSQCLQLHARPQRAALIREKGITASEQFSKSETVFLPVIDDLNHCEVPDVIILCVKNYDLKDACEQIFNHFGDQAIIVALQNGILNQWILPHYFSRIIYGVVCFNSWMRNETSVVYQSKGPFVFGSHPDKRLLGFLNESKVSEVSSNPTELKIHVAFLNTVFPSIICHKISDAALNKLVINLSNSLMTLIDLGRAPIADLSLLQKILSDLLWEGVQVLQASGVKDVRLKRMPSWLFIQYSAMLPTWLTRPLFKRKLKKMVVSSMTQDVRQGNKYQTELESINGVFLTLAERFNQPVPTNRVIYRLCQESFLQEKFTATSLDTISEIIALEKMTQME